MPQHVTSLVRTSVKTANYTASSGDLVPVDTTSGNVTITLPTAPPTGNRVAVKHIVMGAGKAVTVQCGGSDVFNKAGGSTSVSLTLLNQAITLQYDAGIWTVISDDSPLSSLINALGSTNPLGRWKSKIYSDPTNAKMCVLGDSTSDPMTGASTMYRRLYGLHTQAGEALYEVGSTDKFIDGVANGTATYTSASAAFTSNDVGRVFVGANVPLATTIQSVTNSTTVVLTNSVPTGSGLTFWVGRHIIGGGNNGMPLSYWMANPNFTSPNGRYNQTQLLADNPDLVVASWLFNDIRQGALGITENACFTAGYALLKTYVDWHIANLPNCDLLLRMPNTILTADVGNNHFITDGTNTNPAGLAQVYSTALRRIYMAFVGYSPHVDVLDVQGELYGTVSQPSHPYNIDQLHPSSAATGDLLGLVPSGGGYIAIADAIVARCGKTRNAVVPPGAARTRTELFIYSTPAAGQIRFLGRDPNGAVSGAPVAAGDTIYINGYGQVTVPSGGNIDRLEGTNFLQINGLGSTDFTPYIGNTAVIAGNHAGAGVTERQQIFVDVPAISAASWVTFNVTVPGVSPGSDGRAVTVIAEPGSGFISNNNIRLSRCYPSGVDTVNCRVDNDSGATVDLAGESWTFWLVR